MLSSALSSITGETEAEKNSQNQVGNHLRSCSSWVSGLGFIPAPTPTTQGNTSPDSCGFMGIFCFLPPAWAVIPDGLQAKAPEIWAPAPCQCSAVRTHHTDADNTEGTLAFDPGPAPGQSIPHCSAHFYSRINVQSFECQRIYTGHPQTHRKKNVKIIKKLLPTLPQFQPRSSSPGYWEALGWVPLAQCWPTNAERHFVSHSCPFLK